MLHIFLVILKIIGILLAVILGITLLLTLCVLFWPIRYCVKGQNKDGWDIKARISFLGPLVRFSICYREDIEYKLRILGIPFLQSRTAEQEKEQHKKDKPKKTDREQKEKRTGKYIENENMLDEEEEWDKPEPSLKGTLLQGSSNEEIKQDSQEQEKKEQENQEGLISKFWNRMKAKIQAFIRFMKRCKWYLSRVKQICGDEGVHRGYANLKAELFWLLGKLKPRKARWYLKFGFEDPASTGQLLGLLAVIRGFSGYNIQAEPDFEHKIFETDFSIKGFIQGFRLLRTGWKCLFDEDIKYLFDKIRFKEE